MSQEIVIGRGEGCHYPIPDDTVSKFHCKLILENGSYYLFDLNSSNGTYVDKNRIPPYQPIPVVFGADVLIAGRYPLNWQIVNRYLGEARTRVIPMPNDFSYPRPASAPRSKICFRCRKIISEGQRICESCGVDLTSPPRPASITVIAVWLFVNALFIFLSIPSIHEYNSFFFGVPVPVPIARMHVFFSAVLSVGCGIGLLGLRELWRKICVFFSGWSILNGLAGFFAVGPALRALPMWRHLGSSGRAAAETTAYVTVAISIVAAGIILCFLVEKKDYFVK